MFLRSSVSSTLLRAKMGALTVVRGERNGLDDIRAWIVNVYVRQLLNSLKQRHDNFLLKSFSNEVGEGADELVSRRSGYRSGFRHL